MSEDPRVRNADLKATRRARKRRHGTLTVCQVRSKSGAKLGNRMRRAAREQEVLEEDLKVRGEE